MPRPTIKEIAQAAGVSKSAVSYALNGLPGVSAETRSRILEVARRLSWKPSVAARALAGQRIGSIGLAINRPARLLGLEPFYMEFISGVQEVLAPLEQSLVLKVAASAEEEAATYRLWASSRKVDGVMLTDLTADDPRPSLVRSVGLPAVIVGPQGTASLPAISTRDEEAMRETVRYLAALGHRSLARVAGTTGYLHTALRTRTMEEEAASLGLPRPATLPTEFSQEQGIQATRTLLSQPDRPTAIIYDSDLMAAAGLGVAAEMGVDVPGDLSIVAWDNSMLSQLTRPPMTSTSVQVRAYSIAVANTLLDLIAGKDVVSGFSGEPGITVRGSTAPPRTRIVEPRVAQESIELK